MCRFLRAKQRTYTHKKTCECVERGGRKERRVGKSFKGARVDLASDNHKTKFRSVDYETGPTPPDGRLEAGDEMSPQMSRISKCSDTLRAKLGPAWGDLECMDEARAGLWVVEAFVT